MTQTPYPVAFPLYIIALLVCLGPGHIHAQDLDWINKKLGQFEEGPPDSLRYYAQMKIDWSRNRKDSTELVHGYYEMMVAEGVMVNNLRRMLHWADLGLELSSYAEEEKYIAEFYGFKGFATAFIQNPDEGLQYMEQGLALTDSTKMDTERAIIFNNMGHVYMRSGRIPKAIEAWNKALNINQAANRMEGIVKNLTALGSGYRRMNQLNKAKSSLLRALELIEDETSPKVCGTLYELATILKAQNKADSSLYFYQSAQKCSEKSGEVQVQQLSLFGIGSWYQERDSLEKAKHYFLRSLSSRFKENANTTYYQLYLGENYRLSQEWDSAAYWAESALELAQKAQNPVAEATSLDLLGKIALEQKKPQKALEEFDKSLAIMEARQILDGRTVLYVNMGKAFFQTGRLKEASNSYSQSLSLAKSNQQTETIVASYHMLAKIDSAKGDMTKAFLNLSEASQWKDTLSNKKYKKEVAELQVALETTEKEAKIERLLQEQKIQDLEMQQTRNQRNTYLSLALILGLGGLTIVGLFLRIRMQREALVEANEGKTKLFSMVAHDLRGPISGFQALGDIYGHYIDQQNWSRLKELQGQLDLQINHVQHVLDNLLHWSMQQMDTTPSQLEPLNLRDLVSEVVKDYQHTAGVKNNELSIQIPPNLTTMSHANGLRVVIHNLISNAIKYTESGKIQFLGLERESRIELTIKDNGTGMKPERLQQIQDGRPVSSMKGTQAEKGTGIGWTLIRQFARDLNFQYKIESKEGEGTQVTLSFEATP